MPIQVEDNPSVFFTTVEAAKVLHVSRITVMRWIGKGDLKAKKIGKGYRISSQSLHSLLTGRSN